MPKDKQYHFAAGALIALLMGIIIDSVTGMGLAIVAGVAKECYDDYRYGGFSWQDMLTTWVGGCVGFTLLNLCKYWFG